MNDSAIGVVLVIAGITWSLGKLLLSVVDWHMGGRAWKGLGLHQLAPGDRVGWLVQCEDFPAHTRLRAWRGDDYRVIDATWQVQAYAIAALSTRIEKAGWTGVDLAGAGLDVDRLAGLVTRETDKWVVWDEICLHQLRHELGLKAQVVVRPGKVAVREVGDETRTRRQYVQRTGLATGANLLSKHCLAVLACEWQVFWLDPAAALLQGRSLDQVLRMPSIEMRGYHRTHRIDRLTAADLEPVRIQVMTLIDRTADIIASVLDQGTQRKPKPMVPSRPRAVESVASG